MPKGAPERLSCHKAGKQQHRQGFPQTPENPQVNYERQQQIVKTTQKRCMGQHRNLQDNAAVTDKQNATSGSWTHRPSTALGLRMMSTSSRRSKSTWGGHRDLPENAGTAMDHLGYAADAQPFGKNTVEPRGNHLGPPPGFRACAARIRKRIFRLTAPLMMPRARVF